MLTKPWVSIALWTAILVAVGLDFAFLRGLNDADLFWHLLNGEQLIATGAPVTADPFSFTYPGGARVPHEWLSEGAMYLAIQGIGPDWSLALFAAAVPLSFGALGGALLRHGAKPLAIVAGMVLPALVAFPYLSVRPQVISWAFLALLLGFLLWLDVPRRRWVLLVVPLFVLWANAHALYAVGLALLGWFTLWTLVGRSHLAAARRWVAAALGLSIAGSALTPSGIRGVLYPLRFYNGGDWGLANIPEWASPNFHDAVQLPLLLLIIALALVPKARVPGWLLGLAVIGVVMALLANRNAPVAAIFAAPALVLGVSDALPERAHRRDGGRRAVEIVATGLFLLGGAYVAVSNAGGIRLDRFPVAAVDVLETRKPDARVLAEYGWGGYVAYRLHDAGGAVFVDGRNDMYPERILYDYVAIRDADDGWQRLADQYDVEVILLKPEEPLVRGVAQINGWCEEYRDSKQVLLIRCVAS